MKSNNYLLLLSLIFFTLSACKITTEDKSVINEEKDLHIYLLMGQSNMAGRGKIEPQDTVAFPRVFMLDSNFNWVAAKSPIHYDKPAICGTGLGHVFGKIMAEQDTNIKIGLIPCAVGGSTIETWADNKLHKATGTYPLNETITRAKKGMETGVIKGILWHQGESNCGSTNSLKNYKDNFFQLKTRLEDSLATGPLPIVIGELGYFLYTKEPQAITANFMFKLMANETPLVELVSAIGLNHKGDSLHFNSESYRKMGERYARAMLELHYKQKNIQENPIVHPYN